MSRLEEGSFRLKAFISMKLYPKVSLEISSNILQSDSACLEVIAEARQQRSVVTNVPRGSGRRLLSVHLEASGARLALMKAGYSVLLLET